MEGGCSFSTESEKMETAAMLEPHSIVLEAEAPSSLVTFFQAWIPSTDLFWMPTLEQSHARDI